MKLDAQVFKKDEISKAVPENFDLVKIEALSAEMDTAENKMFANLPPS
jgi:hypothetical protein